MSTDNDLTSYIAPTIAWSIRVLVLVGVIFLFAVYFEVSWNDIKNLLLIILDKITF